MVPEPATDDIPDLIGVQEAKSVYNYSDAYYKICIDVRNMKTLTSQQMDYVRTLPKDKLVELVEIYNMIMETVNYLIEKD